MGNNERLIAIMFDERGQNGEIEIPLRDRRDVGNIVQGIINHLLPKEYVVIKIQSAQECSH